MMLSAHEGDTRVLSHVESQSKLGPWAYSQVTGLHISQILFSSAMEFTILYCPLFSSLNQPTVNTAHGIVNVKKYSLTV